MSRSALESKSDSSSTAFAMTHEKWLRQWGLQLQQGSGPLVAISRKGPRLLELAVRASLIPQDLLRSVTTERGILFSDPLALSGQTVTIVDDSVIIGSTFKHVIDVTSEHFPDATIAGRPFALSESAQIASDPYIASFAIKLIESDCTAFVNSETAAFAVLNKPYDIDHPILKVRLTPGATEDDVMRCLATTPQLESVDIYRTPRRFTDVRGDIVERAAWSINWPQAEHAGTIWKIRCYFDVDNGELSLVAIAPQVATLSELVAKCEQLPDKLAQCWQEVSRTKRAPTAVSSASSLAYDRSLVTWANYLLELAGMSTPIAQIMHSLSSQNLLLSESLSIEPYDIQLLVGLHHSGKVASTISGWLQQPRRLDPLNIASHRHHDVAPLIPPQHLRTYEEAKEGLVFDGDAVIEILENEFQAQHIGIELPGRELHLASDRLDFGVPLTYLWSTVEARRACTQLVELHQALDCLIDRGVIVPRFIGHPSDEMIWYRGFRVGERPGAIIANVTRDCISILASALGTTVLPEVLTEKYLLLASENLLLFNDPSLSAETVPSAPRGFVKGYHLYGARPAVLISDRKEWLVDWAVDKRILRRKTDPNAGRLVGTGYELNPSPVPYFKQAEPSFKGTNRMAVGVLAQWVEEVKDDPDLGVDFLITITTVESEQSYAQALEALIRGWLDHPAWSYSHGVACLEDFVRNKLTALQVDTTLADIANWYSQAQHKRLLRDSMGKKILYASQKWAPATVGATASLWNDVLLPAIGKDSAAQPHHKKIVEEVSWPVLSIIRHANSLMRVVLSENSDLHRDKPETVVVRANRTIEAIEQLPAHLRRFFDNALFELRELAATSSLVKSVTKLRFVLEAIADGVSESLDLFPDLSNEAVESIQGRQFVLKWDVLSSSAVDEQDLPRIIRSVNYAAHQSFRSRLLKSPDPATLDDENFAVCHTFDDAYELARHVARAYGERSVSVRIGCDVTILGTLYRFKESQSLTGTAFSYAKRMMDFFKETKSTPSRFQALGEGELNEPTESFMVVSSLALDYARATNTKAQYIEDFEPIPGLYTPRANDSMPITPYILRKFGMQD